MLAQAGGDWRYECHSECRTTPELAQHLAANDAASERLRQEVTREVAPPAFRTGKDIWDAPRRADRSSSAPISTLNVR
jgi:hypothetical protein